MTITLNRRFYFFCGVLVFVLALAYGLYDWWRARMLEHPATERALELVRENPKVIQELGAEPPNWKRGGWVTGSGFLGKEDQVDIEFILKGSVGELRVVMEAERQNDDWVHTVLRVETLGGELVDDLTAESQVELLRETAHFSTRLSEGEELVEAGKYDEAIEIYQEVFGGEATTEQIVRARRLWGIALQRKGEHEEAEGVLLDALARMLSQEGYGHQSVMGDTGQLPDPVELRTSWSQHVSNLVSMNDLLGLSEWMDTIEALGLTYRYREMSQECIDTFKKLTARASLPAGFDDNEMFARGLPRAHAHLGYCYMMTEGNKETATFHFEQACKLGPNDVPKDVCSQVCRLNPNHPACKPKPKRLDLK